MNMLRTTSLALAIATLPMLAACHRPDDADKAAAQAKVEETGGVIAAAIDDGLEKARKQLHEGNITLNGDGPVIDVNGKRYGPGKQDRNLPKAEITPQGDLLIDGKAVAIDDAQRALLLEYRGEVVAIAEAGIAIGGKGVDLAGSALQQAVGAIFTGNTDELEKQVEAQAKKLQAEAMVLCKQLPPMLATQQQLAASLPEFKPYATMTREDIDDCLKDLEEEQQRANAT
jgi:hypothetical protein